MTPIGRDATDLGRQSDGLLGDIRNDPLFSGTSTDMQMAVNKSNA